MYTFNKIENYGSEYDFCLKLSIDERTKSRLIKNDGKGNEIALVLPRGYILRGGTVLSGEHGKKLLVIAKEEVVSTVRAKNTNELVKLAYHLGNRHVPLQIDDSGFLRYLHDHVLDDMIEKLGGSVINETAPFEPESGAYASGHHHEHSHEHNHEHTHEHGHCHEH